MSKFYGTLQADRGNSTRCGSTFIQATAQSWDGSVSVQINERDDVKWVEICVSKGSTASPSRYLLDVPLADLVDAQALRIETQKPKPEEDEKVQAIA